MDAEKKLEKLSKLPSTRAWLKQYQKPYLTISCGEWTYGHPVIHTAPDDMKRRLVFGRYCSIADNVRITVGRHGKHPLNTLTTYPVGMELDSEKVRRSNIQRPWMDKNLDVVIGNDVWIGSGVSIVAGVTVGTGAVLGMGAIVNKDVPPFAIVVGNPAKINRYRHDEGTIQELLESRWWELDPEQLWEVLGEDLFSSEVLQVIARLKNRAVTAERKAADA